MKRFWLIPLIVCVDFISKWWVHHSITPMQWAPAMFPYGGIGLFQGSVECSIVHVMNRGMAWGHFSGAFVFLLVARILTVGGLLIYMLKKPRSFPLMLIVGGAIGNIVDCFLYGHVIDMIHCVFWGYSYPVFNLADSAICVGAIGLAIQALRRSKVSYETTSH